MDAIRRLVVVALLAVWCFPAVSAAKSPPPSAAQRSAPPTSGTPATSNENDEATWESLATREQKAPQLQNFKGGRVYIYLGSGALLVIVIVLLILLV